MTTTGPGFFIKRVNDIPKLPLTFSSQFWSKDYRTGVERLYLKLEASIVENVEILNQVRARARAEATYGELLLPPALLSTGFGIDDGASLKIGFESVLTSAVEEGAARCALADSLGVLATSWKEWCEGHKARIKSSKALVEGQLSAYEKAVSAVRKAKDAYNNKSRSVDDAEDEIAFHAGRRTSESSASGDDDPGLSESGHSSSLAAKALNFSRSISAKLSTDGLLQPQVQPQASDAIHEGRSEGEDSHTADSSAPVNRWSPSVGIKSFVSAVSGPRSKSEQLVKARDDSEKLEARYSAAVKDSEISRLKLEERISEHLAYAQRCELDRLRAAKSVLQSFNATLKTSDSARSNALQHTATVLDLVREDGDIKALIERHRTGPFRPAALSFRSHYHEATTVNFGLDLRAWHETKSPETTVPPFLTCLLDCIAEDYMCDSGDVPKIDNRRAWLYEIPLIATHHLRTAINDCEPSNVRDVLIKYDLPVKISCLKLWLLELQQPLVYTHDELRAEYNRNSSAVEDDRVNGLVAILGKLPQVNIEVLARIVDHIVQLLKLIHGEGAEDDTGRYIYKLGLSFASCIVRPRQESLITLNDNFLPTFFADLVNYWEGIVTGIRIAGQQRREERYRPRRQRTKPTDLRPMRSHLPDSSGLSAPIKAAVATPLIDHLPSMEASRRDQEQSPAKELMTHSPRAAEGSSTLNMVRGARRGPRPPPASDGPSESPSLAPAISTPDQAESK